MSTDATPADRLVVFTPSGRRARVQEGTTLLDAARGLGVDIDSVCGGRGICGRCAVRQSTGSFAKHGIESRPEHLDAPGADELAYRAEHPDLPADRRLACRTHLLGDAVIDVPPESQVHRQVVRKGVEQRAFEIDPVVSLHVVELERPTLETPGGDLARLFAALEREWGLSGLGADLSVVQIGRAHV